MILLLFTFSRVWVPPLLVLVAFLYFVPAAFAAHRGHPNKGAIFVLNLLLGWTYLGWVVALIWASTAISPQEKLPSRAPTRVESWGLWIAASAWAVWVGAPVVHLVRGYQALWWPTEVSQSDVSQPPPLATASDDATDEENPQKRVILSVAAPDSVPSAGKLCSPETSRALSAIIVRLSRTAYEPYEVRVNGTKWRSFNPTKRRDMAVSISVCKFDGLPFAILDGSTSWSATYSQVFGYEERECSGWQCALDWETSSPLYRPARSAP
jgi:hypothetical protein